MSGQTNNIHYNPFSAEVLADPAAAHKELREKCPVHAFREHQPFFTSLSKHEDVLAALKNIDVFSSQWGQGPGRKPAIALLIQQLSQCTWEKPSIAAVIKEVLTQCALKMPQLAMPVRVLVMGTAQTPSLDAVLELCDREKVLARLAKG